MDSLKIYSQDPINVVTGTIMGILKLFHNLYNTTKEELR